MRCAAIFLFTMAVHFSLLAPASPQGAPPEHPVSPAAAPQTEVVGARPAPPAPPPAVSGEAAYVEPAQVQTLLHKVWLAAFRVSDLLTEVHPERWKLEAGAESSSPQSLEALRAQLAALEQWRGQFEKRTDSMYLGYETYAAISAVLPRLEGVTAAIRRHENSSLAAQYSQAENQLFDSGQALEPYLRYLLRNQDQLLLASQNNLAACQNQLGFAMRPSVKAATPMPNVNPIFRGRRASHAQSPAAKPTASSPRTGMKSSSTAPRAPGSAPAPPTPQKKN